MSGPACENLFIGIEKDSIQRPFKDLTRDEITHGLEELGFPKPVVRWILQNEILHNPAKPKEIQGLNQQQKQWHLALQTLESFDALSDHEFVKGVENLLAQPWFYDMIYSGKKFHPESFPEIVDHLVELLNQVPLEVFGPEVKPILQTTRFLFKISAEYDFGTQADLVILEKLKKRETKKEFGDAVRAWLLSTADLTLSPLRCVSAICDSATAHISKQKWVQEAVREMAMRTFVAYQLLGWQKSSSFNKSLSAIGKVAKPLYKILEKSSEFELNFEMDFDFESWFENWEEIVSETIENPQEMVEMGVEILKRQKAIQNELNKFKSVRRHKLSLRDRQKIFQLVKAQEKILKISHHWSLTTEHLRQTQSHLMTPAMEAVLHALGISEIKDKGVQK